MKTGSKYKGSEIVRRKFKGYLKSTVWGYIKDTLLNGNYMNMSIFVGKIRLPDQRLENDCRRHDHVDLPKALRLA